jgi:Tfp pilus assembly major pilin PilA
MYRQVYEAAIAQIENSRQREIELVKQKVMQEQVVPFCRDIDVALRDAIGELQSAHNQRIAQIQKEFEAEKVALADSANKRKESFTETTIATAVASINADADRAINNLMKFIQEGK